MTADDERNHHRWFAAFYALQTKLIERGKMKELRRNLLEGLHGDVLEIGAGNGANFAHYPPEARVVAIEPDRHMLKRAQAQIAKLDARNIDVRIAPAEQLPFDDASFDAVVSMWTHTDVDDFGAVLREAARVLRPGRPLVYLGSHPCFVGPHARFLGGVGVPELHEGYRAAGRYELAPGVSPGGLRARVGALHLPLDAFVQSFLDAGLSLERFEEPREPGREYPYRVALRARRTAS